MGQYQLLLQEVDQQKASIQEKETEIVQLTASENGLMEHLDVSTKGKKEAEKEKLELTESLNTLSKELECLKAEKQSNTSQVSADQQQVKILTRDNARLLEEINSKVGEMNSAYTCTELQAVKLQYQILLQEVDQQKASIQEKETQIIQLTASENDLMEHLDVSTKGKKEAEKGNIQLAESLYSLSKELECLKVEKQTNTSQVSQEQQQRIVLEEEKVKILT